LFLAIIFRSKFLFALAVLMCAASARADGVSILPLASYNGDQGLGLGGQLLWQKISGSEWNLTGGGFYSPGYDTSVLGVNVQNKKFMDSLYASAGFYYGQTNKNLFYGYGNQSSLDAPSQYSLRSFNYDLRLGFDVTEHSVLGVGYGESRVGVGRGERLEEPQYLDRYSDRKFVNGNDQSFFKAFAMFDDQEPEFAPQSGTKALLEYDLGLNDKPEMSRVLASAARVFPLSEGLLLVGRGRFERVWGGDNPFYSQSRLGGSNTQRGYRAGRWTDFASVLYGAELRWVFWQPGGWMQRMELSAGYEVGRVFNNGAMNVLWDELRPSYVVGLTAVLPQGVPLRLDVAQSPEGTQFYVHLLYPF
jgi:outer membrane protein assembly factor BamA